MLSNLYICFVPTRSWLTSFFLRVNEYPETQPNATLHEIVVVLSLPNSTTLWIFVLCLCVFRESSPVYSSSYALHRHRSLDSLIAYYTYIRYHCQSPEAETLEDSVSLSTGTTTKHSHRPNTIQITKSQANALCEIFRPTTKLFL